MNHKVRELCKDAVEIWGAQAQANVAIEEMAELTVALEHFRRGRATMDEVRTEIADVMITAAQLALIFGEDEVSEEVNAKLDRLKGRIEKAKAQVKKEYYGN